MSRKNFDQDIDYEVLVPPFGLDFYSMTPKQAEENFHWYIQKIPERTEYLRSQCAKDLAISINEVDFSPKSLKLIWRWFLKLARIEKTTKDEIEQMRKTFSRFGESFINKERLSVITEYIIRDIGMYLGELYVRNYPSIRWSFYTKPKRDFFVNRPLLIGFIDNNYNPPFKATFEPIHMAGVQAANLLDKTQKETDLYNIFMKWVEYVPQE